MESLKEKLQILSSLQEQVASLKQEIHTSFDGQYGKEINSRIRRYIDAEWLGEHPGYGYPATTKDFDWSLDGEFIYFSWSETWAYGGHDNGDGYIPLDYFTDDGSKLAEFEAKRQEENKAKEDKEKTLVLEAKRKQLEALKAELGE